jgi:hypothetical protein
MHFEIILNSKHFEIIQHMKASDKVRETLGFILFDHQSFIKKEGEQITFAQVVRDGFADWICRKNDWIVKFTYNELKEPDSNTFVFWQQNRNRFAAATILYVLIPFYKFKGNKPDKHGELILELLDCLVNDKIVRQEKIKELDLQYYWHNEFSLYLKKTLELLDMSDADFLKLDDVEDWLNA